MESIIDYKVNNKVLNYIPFWEMDIKVDTSLNKISSKGADIKLLMSESKIMIDKYNDHLQIYTDGAKNKSKTGCAFYIPDLNFGKQLRITDNSSVFKAESLAILSSLEFIENNPPSKIAIFSDSLSVILAIKNFEKNSNILEEIRYKLYNFQNNYVLVILVWIPGHCGIKNNDIVDNMAKSSLSLPNIHIMTTLDKSDVFNLAENYMLQIWQNE